MSGQRKLLQVVDALARRAASRADCTAGRSSEIKTAMMAMTTSSSISVKPLVIEDRLANFPTMHFSLMK